MPLVILMESKKHKKERWASDKIAGEDGKDWAKILLKLRHPFSEVGEPKKKNGPNDLYYKTKEKKRK